MRTPLFVLPLLLLLAAVPAQAADPCSPPVRNVTEVQAAGQTLYVLHYAFANSDYLFVYAEENNVPGLQSHFDQGLGCTDVLVPDHLLFVTGAGGTNWPPHP